MTPRLALQLAWLFVAESNAAASFRGVPSAEQYAESARLGAIADALFDRAEAGGEADLSIDAAFDP
jgi:hypothetical protein